MTDRRPAWITDAQAIAETRIAGMQWPPGPGAHILTREQLQQTIRDAVIHGYGEGLRARDTALTPHPRGRQETVRTAQAVDTIRSRIEAGVHPDLSGLADSLGMDRSVLVRACQRAGLTLPKGRPAGRKATPPNNQPKGA